MPPLEPGADIGDESLVEAMREGGFVIYIRHASTDFSTVDEEPVDLADCTAQRTLSEVGRLESRRIGESIVDLDIPVGVVLSSEMCRAWETAELAFGEVELTSDLTVFATASSEAEEDERTDVLRALLATPPEAGTNTFVVGHLVNITVAANVTMEEGEAAIFMPSASWSGNGCIDAVDVVD
jgi:phosphohistidine phosphatase SixA